MDSQLISQINELASDYHTSKDAKLLKELEYLLKLLEYQSWRLKYDLKLIEHPGLFRKRDEIRIFDDMFSPRKAYSKYHLIIPLLIHLFTNYKLGKSALETSLHFMEKSKVYLRPGDFAKTKTGAQRFITNTRFASLELRKLGLLRSDKKRFYKYWELSLFGVLVAGMMFNEIEANELKMFKFRYDKNDAKDSTYRVIHKYLLYAQNPDHVKNLFNQILGDEIVGEYLNLYDRKFLKFSGLILDVLKEGYKEKAKSTKQLNDFLDEINADEEISKLADSIVLKKQIDINLESIYRVINGG